MNIHPSAKVILWGSKRYGTNSDLSDDDYYVIVDKEHHQDLGPDIHFITENDFNDAVKAHEVWALEVLFLSNPTAVIDVDLDLLRRKFSAVSSNSWVKCKKKLIDNEPYIAIKSLFHSLRIINFGIQIAKHGKIINYKSCVPIWIEICKTERTWNALSSKFRPLYNQTHSDFRKLAPLNHEKEITKASCKTST